MIESERDRAGSRRKASVSFMAGFNGPDARHRRQSVAAVFLTILTMPAGIAPCLAAQEALEWTPVPTGTGFQSPDTHGLEPPFEAAEKFALSDSADLVIYHDGDPALDVFRDSLALFLEHRGESKAGLFLGLFEPHTRYRLGLINTPNLEGSSDGRRGGYDLEQTLVVATGQVGLSYGTSLMLSPNMTAELALRDDLFLRAAYNLHDLGPSLAALAQGYSFPSVFAHYYTGLSFSTIQNRFSADLALTDGLLSARLVYRLLLTDFFFAEHLVGASLTEAGGGMVSLACDFASYDTLNAVWRDTVRAGIGFAGPFGSLNAECQYGLDGGWRMEVSGRILLGNSERNPALARARRRPDIDSIWPAMNGDYPDTFSGTGKRQKELHHSFLSPSNTVPSGVGWNRALLSRDDLSLAEISAILLRNRISRQYDYSRVFDLNYTHMRSPELFMLKGGVCRDAANTTAHILSNNGFPAKIAIVKRVTGTPHAFVVARARDNGYYLFDYEIPYHSPGARTFYEAAASYSRFLSLYLIDPDTHRVTDVLRTRDLAFLEDMAGIR